MRENFLAFIWKYHYFQKNGLQTSQGEALQVIKVGEENSNTGPDFFNAQLIIDDQKWAGTIELHVKSSDWYVHGHEKDSNYDNVILHVVWEDDAPVFRKDNTQIATLELSKFVEKRFLTNYQKLFTKDQKWINCEKDIATIDKFLLNNWLERLYFDRLEQKATLILELLKQSNNDWEAVLFQLLSKNFGLKVNGEAFFNIAKNLDFSTIRKEAHELHQLEALLFGCAGLLTKEIEETYYQSLQKTYAYQLKKYRLDRLRQKGIQFFRLRPNNFPTIRLAQLAALYHQHHNLFSKIMELKTKDNYYQLFDIVASSFWNTHYTFEAVSPKRSKRLTKAFIDLLLINTIVPLKFIYQKSIGKHNNEEILNIIAQIKPEKNSIIEKFATLNIVSNSALHSQSLLQLKNEYCNRYQCLKCKIGANILRKEE